MPDMVKIPLKGGATLDVDLEIIQGDDFPVEVYRQLILDGLQVRLNGGMTKFKVKDLEGEELAEQQEAIKAKAQENFQALCEGKLKTKSKSGKIPGAVKTRAMQKAKALAKDAIRRAGHKVSAYSAAEIKEMAEEILAADPTIVEEATKEIEAQTKKGEEKQIALPAKFAKDDSRKAKPRGKPEAAIAAAAKKRKERQAHAN